VGALTKEKHWWKQSKNRGLEGKASSFPGLFAQALMDNKVMVSQASKLQEHERKNCKKLVHAEKGRKALQYLEYKGVGKKYERPGKKKAKNVPTGAKFGSLKEIFTGDRKT